MAKLNSICGVSLKLFKYLLMDNNESSNLFLHRHPMMEKKLKVGLGHVIVDAQHWESVLRYLHEHPDLRTELHNASFGQLDEVEELSLKEEENEKEISSEVQ